MNPNSQLYSWNQKESWTNDVCKILSSLKLVYLIWVTWVQPIDLFFCSCFLHEPIKILHETAAFIFILVSRKCISHILIFSFILCTSAPNQIWLNKARLLKYNRRKFQSDKNDHFSSSLAHPLSSNHDVCASICEWRI